MNRDGSEYYSKNQLTDVLYAGPDRLNQQIEAHRRYSSGEKSINEWLLDLMHLRGDEALLDVGCGTGLFLAEAARRLPNGAPIGLDLAEGVLQGARHRLNSERLSVVLVKGDAQALPFLDETFDTVMANYMLYHIPDMERCLKEVRRVMKPGATFVSLTHSRHNEREILDLFRSAIAQLGGELDDAGGNVIENFCAENGEERISAVFPQVTRVRLQHDLRFPTVDSFMDYYRTLTLDKLFDDEPEGQEAVRTLMAEAAGKEIAQTGHFRVHAASAAFFATNGSK